MPHSPISPTPEQPQNNSRNKAQKYLIFHEARTCHVPLRIPPSVVYLNGAKFPIKKGMEEEVESVFDSLIALVGAIRCRYAFSVCEASEFRQINLLFSESGLRGNSRKATTMMPGILRNHNNNNSTRYNGNRSGPSNNSGSDGYTGVKLSVDRWRDPGRNRRKSGNMDTSHGRSMDTYRQGPDTFGRNICTKDDEDDSGFGYSKEFEMQTFWRKSSNTSSSCK